MNHWKKVAFVLTLVAGLCGGAWAQGWGQHGKARDTHQWSQSNHNWSNRTSSNYQYRTGQWGHVPNGAWGGNLRYYPNYRNYPSGNYPYSPNGNYGYYPNYPSGNYGYYPYGNAYPYPTTGGYYPSGPGGYGQYPGAYGYGYNNNSYQIGYAEGMRTGQWDRQSGRPYQPGNYQAYKHGGSVSGSNNQQSYRSGFAAGYRAGYGGGGRRW